ncbi:MAG: hypothetical protein OXG61_02650 [Chloroflexi bacterium]|nr:hypothetical protein [Chloroflexota bacterium]
MDDADVVMFGLPRAPWASETYNGKRCLDDDDSFSYKTRLTRWRTEIASAIASGKTVFVELTSPEVVFVATGEVKQSGTGRNALRNRVVTEQSNLEAIPWNLEGVVTGVGSEIRAAPGAHILRSYWARFSDLSWYEIRFAAKAQMQPLLTTKNPRQLVGAVVETKGGGHLVLLPAVSLGGSDEESERGATSEDDSAFRLNSIDFVRQLLEVDAELRGHASAPPPDWAGDSQYQTPSQHRLREQVNEARKAEEEARESREALEGSLEDAGLLQGLLFAQGRQLEDAVLRALKLMGIEADRHVDDESEFDAVFGIDGQRFLGETEGRDRAAIDIDKITQLERNIGEDFTRDEVTEHAQGVLFGNPQRLATPSEREKTFTPKCISSAERNQFALVLTHQMFEPAAYLEANDDPTYAEACRKAITSAKGQVVQFPKVPGTNVEA